MSIFIALFLIKTPILADYSPKSGLIRKVKDRFCDCSTPPQHEVDFQLIHQPYLKDSLLLFAEQEFGDLDKFISFARVKIIFRFKF